MLNQQSKYSPVNQSRYQKQNDNISFSTFQATIMHDILIILYQNEQTSIGRIQKEVRYTILNREPFIEHQQKSNLYLGNWGKHEKPTLESLSQRRIPNNIPGGLNFDETFSAKRNQTQSKTVVLSQLCQAEKASHKQFKGLQFLMSPLLNLQKQILQDLDIKNLHQNHNKDQKDLRHGIVNQRFNLKLQNKNISNKIVGEQPGFYKYINEAKQGLFNQNYIPNLSFRNKNSYRDQNQSHYIYNLILDKINQDIYLLSLQILLQKKFHQHILKE